MQFFAEGRQYGVSVDGSSVRLEGTDFISGGSVTGGSLRFNSILEWGSQTRVDVRLNEQRQIESLIVYNDKIPVPGVSNDFVAEANEGLEEAREDAAGFELSPEFAAAHNPRLEVQQEAITVLNEQLRREGYELVSSALLELIEEPPVGDAALVDFDASCMKAKPTKEGPPIGLCSITRSEIVFDTVQPGTPVETPTP